MTNLPILPTKIIVVPRRTETVFYQVGIIASSLAAYLLFRMIYSEWIPSSDPKLEAIKVAVPIALCFAAGLLCGMLSPSYKPLLFSTLTALAVFGIVSITAFKLMPATWSGPGPGVWLHWALEAAVAGVALSLAWRATSSVTRIVASTAGTALITALLVKFVERL